MFREAGMSKQPMGILASSPELMNAAKGYNLGGIQARDEKTDTIDMPFYGVRRGELTGTILPNPGGVSTNSSEGFGDPNISGQTPLAVLKKLKEEIVTLDELKYKLREDKTYAEASRNMLQDTGIKTKIIKQYLPIMNKLINTYLTSMEFYINFTLNENFEENIKSRYRDDFTYDSFSEGEKLRIDLSILFTWREIAKMKNSMNTNLLILDEIFDSSLDTAGTDEFMRILYRTMSKENVFVISHKGDTLIDKFPRVMKFEKYKNFTRMAE